MTRTTSEPANFVSRPALHHCSAILLTAPAFDFSD